MRSVHDPLVAHHSQPRRHIPFETGWEMAARPTNLREMRKITVDTANYEFVSVVPRPISLPMQLEGYYLQNDADGDVALVSALFRRGSPPLAELECPSLG